MSARRGGLGRSQGGHSSESGAGSTCSMGYKWKEFLCLYFNNYIYIYMYANTPPETYILYDFTTKNTVSCCFCSRCETSPHRPRFCMTPPAGSTRSGAVSPATVTICISISTHHSYCYFDYYYCYHKHDYYHCRCPCHDQYQHHHTCCKVNNVTITMTLVLRLACCYYYQV